MSKPIEWPVRLTVRGTPLPFASRDATVWMPAEGSSSYSLPAPGQWSEW